MSETEFLPFLPAPRLADAAFAPLPAWVWAPDAGRIVWANAVGAAMFGAPSLAALAQKQLDGKHPAVAQLARLAGSLPESGTRLERLKGFAPGVGRLLTCNCSRLVLADGTRTILVSATEPAGPNLPLGERVRRLLEGFDGPFAAFSPDGALLFATPPASEQLGGASSLAAAGAADLGASALAQGEASGEIAAATLTLQRIGSGNATVLLATLAPLPAAAVAPEPVRAPVADEAPSAPTMPDDALVAERWRRCACSIPPTRSRRLQTCWSRRSRNRRTTAPRSKPCPSPCPPSRPCRRQRLILRRCGISG